MDYIIEDSPKKVTFKLTNNGPEKFTPEYLHLSNLTISLHSFLYNNFRGALSINFVGEPFGSVNICPQGIAYFIKLILFEAHGDTLIKANFTSTQRKFTIEIQHQLGNRDLSYMMKVARMSGFDEEIYESGHIVISTRVFPDKRPAFYNHTDISLKNLITYVFML